MGVQTQKEAAKIKRGTKGRPAQEIRRITAEKSPKNIAVGRDYNGVYHQTSISEP